MQVLQHACVWGMHMRLVGAGSDGWLCCVLDCWVVAAAWRCSWLGSPGNMHSKTQPQQAVPAVGSVYRAEPASPLPTLPYHTPSQPLSLPRDRRALTSLVEDLAQDAGPVATEQDQQRHVVLGGRSGGSSSSRTCLQVLRGGVNGRGDSRHVIAVVDVTGDIWVTGIRVPAGCMWGSGGWGRGRAAR
jgi:hypothetical protein